MRQVYCPSNNPYNIECHSNDYQRRVGSYYYTTRRPIAKPEYTTVYPAQNIPSPQPQQNVQNQPQYDSKVQDELSYESYVNCEKLPNYIVPVLYTPKRVVANEEISRGHVVGNLFKERSYEQLCKGLPVMTEEPPPRQNNTKQATSSILTNSEMIVYKNLMNNLYGIRAKPHGDYNNWSERLRNNGNEVFNSPKQQEPDPKKKIYFEPHRDYQNPNYQYVSDSDYSSTYLSDTYDCKQPLYNIKTQSAPTEGYYISPRLRNTPPNHFEKYPNNVASLQSLNTNYKKIYGFNDPSKRVTTLGSCIPQIRNPFAKLPPTEGKFEPSTMLQTTVEEEFCESTDYEFPETTTECKSTQTVQEIAIESKETQTGNRSRSSSRSENHEKKTIKKNGKRNSEANITVIIDRGWKEDIYTIAGSSLRSDIMETKEKKSSTSFPLVDLLPVIPSESQSKSKDTDSNCNKAKQSPSRDAAVNTYISFCKKKTKSKCSSR